MGLGRKVFGSETLSSAEVQGFLMDQVVMQFDSAAQRDVAIPAPVDGMCTYLRDLDVFAERVNGAWALRRPQNAGTGGVVAGTAPPAGQPLLRKILAGNYASSAFGDNTLPYPGGAFANGVIHIGVSAHQSTGYQWNPWGATLAQTNLRLTAGGGAVQASTTVLTSMEVVGW